MRAGRAGWRAVVVGVVLLIVSQFAGVAVAGGDGTGDRLLVTLGWGANGAGQVGDDTTETRSRAIEVKGGPSAGFSALAAGEGHSLGVGTDRTLWSWGANNCGQLGSGTTTRRGRPQLVSGLTNLQGVAAGRDFSFAWTGGGQVYAWGCNDKGQLGLGTTGGPVLAPTLVPGLQGVEQVAAGYDHVLALASDGRVYGWGRNDDGEIGDGTTVQRAAPVLVSGLSNVREVSAGINHSLAVTNGDVMFSWGSNADGRLCLGTFSAQDQLVPVSLDSVPIKSVAAGGHHTLAIGIHASGDRAVYSCGQNDYGQIGWSSGPSPYADRAALSEPTALGVKAISAGADFSVITYEVDGKTRLYTKGRNNFGQLGRVLDPGQEKSHTFFPVEHGSVPDPGEVIAEGAATGSSARHAMAFQAERP